MQQDLTKLRLFVATPSCRPWAAEYGNSMVNLSSHFALKWERKEIDSIWISSQVASLLPLGREILLDAATKLGATHILFIDDDTSFRPECVDSLISRDLDYVACNMVRKKFPITTTSYGKDGLPVSSVGKTGVEEVHHVGLGMTLIKMDAIKDIPCPHFEIKWLEDQCTYQGEDMYFCDKLRAAGIKLYVDHDASQLVSHIGDFMYSMHSEGNSVQLTSSLLKQEAA